MKKILIWVGIGLVALIVLGAIFGSTGTDDNPASTKAAKTSQPAQTADTDTASDETAATEPGPSTPPAPASFSGTGKKVLDFEVRSDGPVVVRGTHSGQSNFIVHTISRDGAGEEGLFNEIGRWTGQAVWEDAAAGRYRLEVDADGPWTITFTQPDTMRGVALLPGAVKGTGATAVIVRSKDAFNAVVTGTHRGQSNFIVDLIGTGDTTGSVNLFNEIGTFNGETAEDLPEGRLLLYVRADGPWTLDFTR